MSCTACRGIEADMIKDIAYAGMRVLPTLISFILLILFVATLFSGIINLGSIAGTLISGILTVIFLRWDKFTDLIVSIWKMRFGKPLLVTAAVIAATAIAAAVTISIFMTKAASDAPKDENTTVVVLGCKVKEGRPSLMLKRRIEAAYEYLSEHENVKAIVSGGKGSDEAISEAECMKACLVEMGISADRIYMEDKSVSTQENLKFSKDIIERESLPQRVTIVTDAYHQLRASMIADGLGIETDSISSQSPVWLLPTYWIREWFGVTYQFISG